MPLGGSPHAKIGQRVIRRRRTVWRGWALPSWRPARPSCRLLPPTFGAEA